MVVRKILHVVGDTLFVDSNIERFNLLQGYENKFMYYKYGFCKSNCKKIKKIDSVLFPKNINEIISNLTNTDVIFFHGLFYETVKFHRYINKDKIVIWFPYGQELYQASRCNSRLIKIPLYKPLTRKTYPCLRTRFLTFLLNFFGMFRLDGERKKFLSRVDYVSTVFPIEFEILSKLKYFHAKPFLLRGIRGFSKSSPVFRKTSGSIMLGHSAVYTDNHIDIIHTLNKITLHGRTIIMPINYGHSDWKHILKKYKYISGLKVSFIEDIMPKNEYFDMMKGCSHAIFGPLRQQAAGNINACMKMGIKVFLYKDSMDYIQYKKDGYIVFSIEDDLSLESLSTPLTDEQSLHNFNKFYSILGFENKEDVLKNIQNNFDSLFK